MQKDEQIKYLNQIKPFINLKAMCDDYNKRSNNPIDYNNLRTVLNGVSKTRLSEEKLDSFINYLYYYLYPKIFNVYDFSNPIQKTTLTNIVIDYANKIADDIIKELENEFRNNRK